MTLLGFSNNFYLLQTIYYVMFFQGKLWPWFWNMETIYLFMVALVTYINIAMLESFCQVIVVANVSTVIR